MNTSKWPKHLFALDITRGIASVSVVLWHWQHFAYEGGSISQDFVRENQPLYNLLALFYEKGALGVQYFFLLSGFIFFWLYAKSISSKKVSAWEFGVNRFSRLYPLHVVTLIIVAILQYFYRVCEGGSFVYQFNDAYHFILNLFFASKWGFEDGWSFNAPIWSVSIEILLYGIFFLVVMSRLGGWVYCLTISILSFTIDFFVDHSIFIGLAMFFLGGVVFHIANLLLTVRNKIIPISIHAISVLSWVGVITNFYFFDLSHKVREIDVFGDVIVASFPLYILFPFTVLSLVLIEVKRGLMLKPFSWIGDITYSSYLLHFPFQLLFVILVSLGILDHNFYLSPIFLLVYFIILIPCSYLVFIKFERPMQRIIRTKLLSRKKW